MLNQAKPIVPPMRNVVGDTHAETKAEIEARKRAQLAAEQAMLAAEQAEAEKEKTPWSSILVLIFGIIAIAGAGFAVYEHTENEKLQQRLIDTNTSLSQSLTLSESLQKDLNDLKAEYEALKAQLDMPETEAEETSAEATSEASGEATPETPTETATE